MSTADYATTEPATEVEHRVEHIGGLFRSFDIPRRVERLLNHRAAEGWTLIGMHRSLFNRYTLVLRRTRPM